jgi:protein FRG1
VPDAPGVFSLQTARETFLSAKAKEEGSSTVQVRADADSIEYPTHIRIRMQARFKPRHKEKKAEKAREKISRKELEEMVGRRLEEDEVRTLKRARREGDFHEKLLDVKVKGKHDKFA